MGLRRAGGSGGGGDGGCITTHDGTYSVPSAEKTGHSFQTRLYACVKLTEGITNAAEQYLASVGTHTRRYGYWVPPVKGANM